jgi:hypothetical protein
MVSQKFPQVVQGIPPFLPVLLPLVSNRLCITSLPLALRSTSPLENVACLSCHGFDSTCWLHSAIEWLQPKSRANFNHFKCNVETEGEVYGITWLVSVDWPRNAGDATKLSVRTTVNMNVQWYSLRQRLRHTVRPAVCQDPSSSLGYITSDFNPSLYFVLTGWIKTVCCGDHFERSPIPDCLIFSRYPSGMTAMGEA